MSGLETSAHRERRRALRFFVCVGDKTYPKPKLSLYPMTIRNFFYNNFRQYSIFVKYICQFRSKWLPPSHS